MSLDFKDFVSKGLLTGVINAAEALLLVQGTDMIRLSLPFLGAMTVPDSVVLFISGFLGQVASDFAHDYMYKSIPAASKFRQAGTALTSLAVYNAVQLPILISTQFPTANIPYYVLGSSSAHYAAETLYHDIFNKDTGGILI